MIMYRAVVLHDYSENGYITVHDKLYQTEIKAKLALKKIRGHCKYITPLEVDLDE